MKLATLSLLAAAPAYASDPGDPDKPILIDPTGAAVPDRGGCTPVFLVVWPETPPGIEHMSDSGQELKIGDVCPGWGTDAIEATRQKGEAASTSTGEAPPLTELPAEVTSALNSAISRIEIAADVPVSTPPPDTTNAVFGAVLLAVALSTGLSFLFSKLSR